MIARQVSYWAGIGVLGLALAGLAVAQGTPAATAVADNTLLGVTMPSQPGRSGEQGQLHSLVPGIVRELKVKDGDTVKAGQVLMVLDDRLEKAQFAIADLQAKSDAALKAAEADLAQKKVELKRQQDMVKRGVAQALEVERAEVEVTIGEARLDLAKQEMAQKKLEADAKLIQLEQMQIKTPVDGVVKLEVGIGQRTDPNRPVCTVIRSDPLWVRVNIKAEEVTLALNEVVKVKYKGDQEWTETTVIFLNPQVDAASGKREVRMEMPNKAGKPPGLEVQVMLGKK